MAYRRRRGMGYGRRRRFNRRRPNTGRSVPRTTFAPRHQYLKLRQAVSFTAIGNGSNGLYFAVALNRPKSSIFDETPAYANASEPDPLGWTEYGNIFAKYVVHGVKFNLRTWYEESNVSSTAHEQGNQVSWAFHTTVDGTRLNKSVTQLSSYPLGGTAIVTIDKPLAFKRYMSCSKVAGRPVAQYSDFINEWNTVGTGTGAAAPKLCLTYATNLISIGTVLRVTGTMTWYVSAVAIKENIASPAAAVAINALTDPGVTIGEPSKATALDHEAFLASGVAQDKRTLSEMNMGGRG